MYSRHVTWKVRPRRAIFPFLSYNVDVKNWAKSRKNSYVLQKSFLYSLEKSVRKVHTARIANTNNGDGSAINLQSHFQLPNVNACHALYFEPSKWDSPKKTFWIYFLAFHCIYLINFGTNHTFCPHFTGKLRIWGLIMRGNG